MIKNAIRIGSNNNHAYIDVIILTIKIKIVFKQETYLNLKFYEIESLENSFNI